MTTSETFRAIRSESAQIRLLTTLLDNNDLEQPAYASLSEQRRQAYMRRGKLKRLLAPKIVPMQHQELWLEAARRGSAPCPDLPA